MGEKIIIVFLPLNRNIGLCGNTGSRQEKNVGIKRNNEGIIQRPNPFIWRNVTKYSKVNRWRIKYYIPNLLQLWQINSTSCHGLILSQ